MSERVPAFIASRLRPRRAPRVRRRGVGRQSGQAAALITACLVTVGCGSQPVTKQDVVARANAICASALRQVRAIPPPSSTSGSPLALGPYVRQVASIVQREAAQIAALPKPVHQRALLERFMGAVKADAAHYQALATAARSGDGAAEAQALAGLRASQSAQLASRYGLGQCAGSGTTAVS